MILITGGAGFIGKHLVRQSLSHGKTVVIDTAPRPRDFLPNPHLFYKRANAESIETLLSSEERSNSKIVHLAADTSVSRSILKPLSSLRNNIGLTCNLLEFARKVDSETFLFASSAAVYGNKIRACSESSSPDPLSPYAVSKLAAEYYCRVYAKVYGIHTVILRVFNVYGPGQLSGVIPDFLRAVSMGRSPIIYGDGRQTRDFIFVQDVIDAIMKSLRAKLVPGITLNIGTGKATTVEALALKALHLLGKAGLRPKYMPARVGDVRYSVAKVTLARKKIAFNSRLNIEEGLRLMRPNMMGS